MKHPRQIALVWSAWEHHFQYRLDRLDNIVRQITEDMEKSQIPAEQYLPFLQDQFAVLLSRLEEKAKAASMSAANMKRLKENDRRAASRRSATLARNGQDHADSTVAGN